jgi:hypothetical protein
MPALNAKTARRRQDLDAGKRQPSASTYSPWRRQQPAALLDNLLPDLRNGKAGRVTLRLPCY